MAGRAATDYADVRDLYGAGNEWFTDEDIDTVIGIARRHGASDHRITAARLLLRMSLTLSEKPKTPSTADVERMVRKAKGYDRD